jgi:hypothetical protein
VPRRVVSSILGGALCAVDLVTLDSQEKGAKVTAQADPHREEQFQAMMAFYHPPTWLKKSHKDFLKTAWSIREGYDGSKLSCLFCGKVKELREITVHHKDGIETHNDPANLGPACKPCNETEGWAVRKRRQAEDREKTAQTQAALQAGKPLLPYTSEESARSFGLRTKFNRWAYDPATGMAKDVGGTWHIKGLANQAVHGVGIVRGKLGDSSTFEKYIKADLAGGIWNIPDNDDPEKIERTSKPFPFPTDKPEPEK